MTEKTVIISSLSFDTLYAVSGERKEESEMLFGSFGFRVDLEDSAIADRRGVCLILKETETTFYVMIHAARLLPFSTDEKKPYVDLLALEEGRFEDGVWKAGAGLTEMRPPACGLRSRHS